jgi:hypothetical protein
MDHFELSRRDFLRAGAGAFAGACTGTWAAAPSLLADDKVAAGLIDAHSHIWTRDVTKFPLADGQTVEDLDPPSFTA